MAPDEQLVRQAQFREAFIANERQVRINTGKLACALVFVLMPLGVTADFSLYRDFHGHNYVGEFFCLRLLCSMLVLGVWLLHYTPIARKFYPLVCMPIVILPAPGPSASPSFRQPSGAARTVPSTPPSALRPERPARE